MATKVAPPRFRVGEVVAFPYGVHGAQALVREQRGPLGVNGRHIYRIRMLSGLDEPIEFEMPEDELSPLALSRDEVVNYLASGGLIDMLGRNQSGGPNPPRVWLTFNPVGQLSHTYVEEDGVRGGEAIPFFSLAGRKIFEPEKGRVLRFLKSFGLNQADAEEVIHRVGTS